MKHKKHKNLTYSTRNIPGYTAPTTVTRKGGKSPCQQPFIKPWSK